MGSEIEKFEEFLKAVAKWWSEHTDEEEGKDIWERLSQ